MFNQSTKNPQPKLHAYLASIGLGSRREIEKWIAQKEVTVNGELATIGQRVSAKDKIAVRGTLVKEQPLQKQDMEVLLYHKPIGQVCTRSKAEKRPTVFEYLPKTKGRWVSVGRLDINSSGLLLLTNNGDLAHRLMHPKFEVERKYRVRVFGTLTKAQIKQMTDGMQIDGTLHKAKSAQALHSNQSKAQNQWFEVVLTEGKNREIRKLIEGLGAKVSRLIRVSYGPIVLPNDLPSGGYIAMNPTDLKKLVRKLATET